MGDRSLVGGVESDCEGSAEADGGEGDIVRCVLGSDSAVAGGRVDEPVEDASGGVALLGPIVVVEEREDDVHRTKPDVDCCMKIPTQRFAAGR